ncbi:MAG: hypothetical protein IPK82_27700 [Polyangiaceae bacterium]|nr:hypothetical protein [Polyangiaceae bacterium]
MRLPRTRDRFFGAAWYSLAVGWVIAGSGCIIDLNGLTTPGAGGNAGASGEGGGGTTSGTGAPGGGGTGGGECTLLDCCPEGQVIEVAKGSTLAGLPRDIVVGPGGVIWVNMDGDNMVRMPASGGPAEVLVQTPSPRGLAVVDNTAVWTAQDGVHTCSLADCAGSNTLVAAVTTMGSVTAVAFDGSTVLYSDLGSGAGDGKVFSCQLGNCNPITLGSNLIDPGGVALYGLQAFWTDRGDGNDNGTVARSPKNVDNYSQVSAALNLPTHVIGNEEYVYWTEQVPNGQVVRCPIAGGYCDSPEPLAPNGGPFNRPGDIVFGAGRVYWVNQDDGTIVSCPEQGCGADLPKVHVSGRTGLARLVIGDSCLFWTENGGGGAVFKTAR